MANLHDLLVTFSYSEPRVPGIARAHLDRAEQAARRGTPLLDYWGPPAEPYVEPMTAAWDLLDHAASGWGAVGRSIAQKRLDG